MAKPGRGSGQTQWPGRGCGARPRGSLRSAGAAPSAGSGRERALAEWLVLIFLALVVVRRDGGLLLPYERVVGVDGDVRGLGQVLEHFLGFNSSPSRCASAVRHRLDRTEGRSGARKCAGARDLDFGPAGRCRRLGRASLASSTLPRGLGRAAGSEPASGAVERRPAEGQRDRVPRTRAMSVPDRSVRGGTSSVGRVVSRIFDGSSGKSASGQHEWPGFPGGLPEQTPVRCESPGVKPSRPSGAMFLTILDRRVPVYSRLRP